MAMKHAVPGQVRALVDGRLQLVGRRCKACSTYAFPRSAFCKRCASAEHDEVLLGPDATLFSITVDRSAGTSANYRLVGQVRFGEGAWARGYVVGDVDKPPRIGESVEVVPYEFKTSDSAEPLATYGFRCREHQSA